MMKSIGLCVIVFISCYYQAQAKNIINGGQFKGTVDSRVQTRVGQFNTYYVYTRNNPKTPVELSATEDSVLEAGLISGADTIVIVHGHEESAASSLNIPIKNAILTAQDANVITVDWELYASQTYSTAVTVVPDIAEGISELIQFLVSQNETAVSLSQLHLVGFDLGAHIVGIVGRNLDGEVARITGLDPSGSEWDEGTERLTSSDAQYVEVIHTDGFTTNANGIGESIGDVDFFSNNGESTQPGCSDNACSHMRAWELFESSILNDNLLGYRCDSIDDMSDDECHSATLKMGGLDLVKYGSGIYRITTVETYPYIE